MRSQDHDVFKFKTYFDLLCDHKYFNKFLGYFNSKYGQPTSSAVREAQPFAKPAEVTVDVPEGMTEEHFRKLISRFLSSQVRQKPGEEKEPHYRSLIKRYYMIHKGISSPSSVTSDHVAALIGDEIHIKDVYMSLKKEFGMGTRGGKLVPLNHFFNSLQTHKQILVAVSSYRMDAINPSRVPGEMLEQLRTLFEELDVVPSSQKTKLVAVSKTLHFLLPDLVMPIDSKVLKFLRKKGDIPPKSEKQFDWFKEVFRKYLEITDALGLKQSNGDGNWWNWSVPKRIDNAIMGFWELFSDDNIERIICGHIDMLLQFLSPIAALPAG